MQSTTMSLFNNCCGFIQRECKSKNFTTAPVTKSSKYRRELINEEIDHIRTLLPLQNRSLQRLSQLEVMSMACIFIRRCHILGSVIAHDETYSDIMKAVPGFFLVCTAQGKLVYISDNITDFLGHSMVDITKQGDNIYDIIDQKDHTTVKSSLESTTGNEVNFQCRISLSRYTRRQPSFFDEKPIQVTGYFVSPATTTNGSTDGEQVMVALCTPILCPALKASVMNHGVTTFTSVHSMDMRFIEVSESCQYYLGYNEEELVGRSWYDFVAPEYLSLAAKHHMTATEGMMDSHTVFYGRFMNRVGEKFPVAVSLYQHKTEDLIIFIISIVQVLRESRVLDGESQDVQAADIEVSEPPLPTHDEHQQLSPLVQQSYSQTAVPSYNERMVYQHYPPTAYSYDFTAAYQQHLINGFPLRPHQPYEESFYSTQMQQCTSSPSIESHSAHSHSPVQYAELTNCIQAHNYTKQHQTATDRENNNYYLRQCQSMRKDRSYGERKGKIDQWKSTSSSQPANSESFDATYNLTNSGLYNLPNEAHRWQIV